MTTDSNLADLAVIFWRKKYESLDKLFDHEIEYWSKRCARLESELAFKKEE